MKPSDSIPFRSMFRWMFILAGLILPQVVQAQTQWHATVGAQSKNMGHQALAFLPNEIWIHTGDSITWTFNVDEIHTVTFLTSGQTRPFFFVGCPGFSPDGSASFDGSTCVTTSAFLPKGQNFTITFPAAGNFKLVCLVHENMTGVVHVLNSSEPLPHSQAFYDEQAEAERENLLSDTDMEGEDHDGHDSHHRHSPENQVTAGTGEVVATGGGSQSLSILRFLHPATVVHVNETIEWTNLDPATPHTITFGKEPGDVVSPFPLTMPLDADGARHAVINSTTDRVHSGFIIAAPQERTFLAQSPLGVTRFRITFKHAGTFPYICALHDGLGMKGKVIVLP